jgi:hypothetical protein
MGIFRCFCALTLLLLIGCGADGSSDAADAEKSLDLVQPQDLVVSDALPPETLLDVDYSQLDMTGTWAQYQEVSTLADAPLIGEVKTLSRAFVRLTVVQDGDSVQAVQEVCSLSLDAESEFAQTVIPDAFVNSLHVVTKLGIIAHTDDHVSFEQFPAVELHGVKLDNQWEDELPTSPDDPRVLDQDEDGKPGLTVYINGLVDGEIYVIQRAISSLDGTFQGPDRITGLMDWNQEQVVLGSDNPILRDNPIDTRVDPDAEASFFISARVEDGMDCEQIMQKKMELFGLDY